MRSFVIGITASLALTAAAGARDLTVERLFDAPDLQGPSLRQPRFSPDGTLVSYLRGKDDDPQVYDLWAYDIAAGQHRLLVDSRSLVQVQETLPGHWAQCGAPGALFEARWGTQSPAHRADQRRAA